MCGRLTIFLCHWYLVVLLYHFEYIAVRIWKEVLIKVFSFQVKEDCLYTCGMELFSEGEYYNIIVVQAATCDTSVSMLYYSARINFPTVCYVCGDSGQLHPLPENLEKFRIAHPVYETCFDKGHKPRTRK